MLKTDISHFSNFVKECFFAGLAFNISRDDAGHIQTVSLDRSTVTLTVLRDEAIDTLVYDSLSENDQDFARAIIQVCNRAQSAFADHYSQEFIEAVCEHLVPLVASTHSLVANIDLSTLDKSDVEILCYDRTTILNNLAAHGAFISAKEMLTPYPLEFGTDGREYQPRIYPVLIIGTQILFNHFAEYAMLPKPVNPVNEDYASIWTGKTEWYCNGESTIIWDADPAEHIPEGVEVIYDPKERVVVGIVGDSKYLLTEIGIIPIDYSTHPLGYASEQTEDVA